MSSSGSVSEWIEMLKSDQRDPAQRLWARYVERLVRVASKKLGRLPRKAADEEDVVIVAFESFLRGVQSGRFSKLNDRHDLWQILVVLTERKAIDQIRAELVEKRGGGRVRGESAVTAGDDESWVERGLEGVPGAEPTSEFAVQAADELRRLLELLNDSELGEVAVAKMEGYTNEEIAQRLGKSTSSVERKLRAIRNAWKAEIT